MFHKIPTWFHFFWLFFLHANAILFLRTNLKLHVCSAILKTIVHSWLKLQRSLLNYHCTEFRSIISNPKLIFTFEWEYRVFSADRNISYSDICLMPSSHTNFYSFIWNISYEIDYVNYLWIFFLQCVDIKTVQDNIRYTFVGFRYVYDVYQSNQAFFLVFVVR